MIKTSVIGLDLAKNIFHLVTLDGTTHNATRRRLHRTQVTHSFGSSRVRGNQEEGGDAFRLSCCRPKLQFNQHHRQHGC